MSKQDLNKLLAPKAAQPIVRGKGFQLSTEQEETAPTAAPRPAPPERQSVRIRKDLLKRCRRIAVEEETTLAEIIETAVDEWLQRHQ
jgi:hypothetical protein